MTKQRRYANRAKQVLLAVVLSCLFNGSAWAQLIDGAPVTRIIGGTTAAPSAYPWAVALLQANVSNAYYAQFCGGSLIADRWVMTAAHCVADAAAATDIEVSVGIADLSSVTAGDRQTIKTIYVHPSYNAGSQNNDIALLELTTPVANTPVALADETLMSGINDGDLLSIIGWGSTDTAVTQFPLQLQETQIPLYNYASCNSIYGSTLTSNMLCAGYTTGGYDTCQGDSGGPLLYDTGSGWAQTGITSFGYGCAQPDTPGVYTRVAGYRSWISTTTRIALANRHRFGYVGIGHGSDTQISLSNYSGADITVTSVNLTTTSQFTLQSEDCSGGIIANNASCTISLRFQPSLAGSQLATLNVDLGDGSSLSSELSGVGLNGISASALDDNSLVWYSGGDATWLNYVISNSNGGSALRSGDISDSQSSALVTYVSGPRSFSFRWKASTEAGYDVLKFYVDGSVYASISGEVDWTQKSLTLGSGEHALSWVYSKDSSVSSIQDSVWLDSVNSPYNGSSGSSGGGSSSGSEGGFGSGGGSLGIYWLLLLLLFHVMRRHRMGLTP